MVKRERKKYFILLFIILKQFIKILKKFYARSKLFYPFFCLFLVLVFVNNFSWIDLLNFAFFWKNLRQIFFPSRRSFERGLSLEICSLCCFSVRAFYHTQTASFDGCWELPSWRVHFKTNALSQTNIYNLENVFNKNTALLVSHHLGLEISNFCTTFLGTVKIFLSTIFLSSLFFIVFYRFCWLEFLREKS